MKNRIFFVIILFLSIIYTGCNRKSGCPAMNQTAEFRKNNALKKQAKTRLFSKKSKIKYYPNQGVKKP
jgi:hypothetical protein